VNGFPSDSVRVAIDEMELTPDLVVSGINEGQNVGPLVDVSGTIGAARAAVARGVPALALSASTGPFEEGYAAGATLAVEWVTEHAVALLDGSATVEVTSINIPSCATGEPEDLVEVPVGTEGDPLAEPDCASDLTDPADDIEGLANGFPTLTIVPAEPATPPQPG
jgi:5'-nucleotidase